MISSRTALNVTLAWVCLLPITVEAAPVHVEVIVFANHGPTSTDSEWTADVRNIISVEPELIAEDEDVNEDQDAGLQNNPDHPKPVASKLLSSIAQSMDNLPDFEILNYLSWVQEPLRRNKSVPVVIDVEHPETPILPQKLLAGFITLYDAQQLLHVEIDATYKPIPDTRLDTLYLKEPIVHYQVNEEYSLLERRQVQINDLHYFDHPKFGVIVTVGRP